MTSLISLATLYLQWHSEGIDFGVLAYYAIHSRHISDNLLRMITSVDHPLSVVGDRWQEQIAAVYYGVPLEKAAQVVLDEPLREAISSFNEGKFRRLDRFEQGNSAERKYWAAAMRSNWT